MSLDKSVLEVLVKGMNLSLDSFELLTAVNNTLWLQIHVQTT